MVDKRKLLTQLWIKWTAPALLVLFCGVSIGMAFLQHAAYQTSLYDLGYYTQVIWNLSHGNGFVTSLGPGNYLTNHFSLMLLIFAPLFSVWSDPRVLMIVQPIALASTIVPGYLILRRRYPRLAPAFVALFVLSPLLHQVAATEFHGVMLAAPFLAWAFYALHTERRRMMLIALGLALLVREDVGLYVASFGLFLFVCRRGWRLLGLGLTVGGGAWFVLMVIWIMPSFGTDYHHFYAFPTLGDSVPEILSSALRDPLHVLGLMLTPVKIKAVLGFIAPLAGLPILAAGYMLLWLPMMLFYLVGVNSIASAGLFSSYRLAPFLPLVWGSMAVVLARLPLRQAVVGLGGLALATLIGFLTLSPFPGGAKFDPSLYQITPRAEIAEQIVESIPADAYVVTQSLLGAHLATRSNLKLFSGYNSNTNRADYVFVDATTRQTYQLTPDDFKVALSNIEIDPLYDIVREQDGFFVFKPVRGQATLQRTISATWSSTLQLVGADLAQANSSGPFTPIVDRIEAGGQLRVMLYWTALQPMPEYLSISVQLVDSAGVLLAQDDNWPGHGAVPSPLWEVGRSLRDIHYLDLSNISLPAQVRLIVKVYYSGSLELLAPVEGYTLATVQTR